MTRTTKLKVTWIVLVVAIVAAFSTWYALARPPAWQLALVVLALLVPGRVQGILYRDFFTGRRLLESGRQSEAIDPFERFRESLGKRPWLKPMLWLSWSTYSVDPEVMVCNNLGACYMHEGNLPEAERCLALATERDPKAPLVQFNPGLVSFAQGDEERAMQYLAKARELGFRGDASDEFVQRGQQLLARVEGRLPE